MRFPDLFGHVPATDHDDRDRQRQVEQEHPSPRRDGQQVPADERAGAFVKEYVAWGAGPRGSQFLVLAAKARALLEGRTVPTVEDVRATAMPVLRHRIIANHRAIGDSIGAGAIVDHLLREVAA